ncbi:DUF3472 domain-containing protein [Olivibacter sp. SDN3]|uniref:DUF3472 domain-containing protein n=1 Tax=Olivibacter sp. SDN3 TaxID=2764720 RepID=UPI00165141CF|nr:DUF3472 domain-containing protein [Olivibacter sp. SDN3]QNL52330.1 DUF3472 domain-containing protein [Olivibacter sp. SDN3]
MKNRIFILFIVAFMASVPHLEAQQKEVPSNAVTVPIGGNTWQVGDHTTSLNKKDVVGKEGIKEWKEVEQQFKTFVRFGATGTLDVWLKATSERAGSLVAMIGSERKLVELAHVKDDYMYLGEWNINDTGYVAIHLQGKGPINLSNLAEFKLAGTAVTDAVRFVKNDEGNFFYWGRRGPSTHLNYQTPEDKDIRYYYNEVTVPEGNDVIGSYYMANGFSGGYFGIQVNSPDERRVLFSVWSPFETDNPEEIPEDQQIKLLKKGEEVYTGEFGNEGSGGQSFLRYNWKAGETYGFLLKGEPVENNYTNYTAWFFTPELGEWQLIASFSRPQTQTWLKGFHSFLENFSPKQGVYERRVYFGNQWVVDKEGNWYEVMKARFSADNTARAGFRLDYSGGSEKNRFYLHNFGFFSDYTPIGQSFDRSSTVDKQPVVDFDKLP